MSYYDNSFLSMAKEASQKDNKPIKMLNDPFLPIKVHGGDCLQTKG